MRRITMLHALSLGAIAAFACGAAWAAARPAGSAAPAVVGARSTSLGTILVDARGKTLYLFERDKGGVSACYAKCAAAWPPLLTTGRPQAGTGARAALIGTMRRNDGRVQVTYAKHPLYRFVLDRAAGQTKGEGSNAFGGEWYAVSPQGTKVVKESSPGGGYGRDGGSGYGGYGN